MDDKGKNPLLFFGLAASLFLSSLLVWSTVDSLVNNIVWLHQIPELLGFLVLGTGSWKMLRRRRRPQATLILILASTSFLSGFQLASANPDTRSGGAIYKNGALNGCSGTAVNIPRYRDWVEASESWSSEVCLPTADAELINMRIEWSRTASKAVAVTQDLNGNLDLMVCTTPPCTNSGDWSIPSGCDNFADTFSVEPARPHRTFDVEFEQASGDAMVFFGASEADGDTSLDIGHITFTTTCSAITWESVSAEVASNAVIGHFACEPFSSTTLDKIGCIYLDRTNSDSIAFIWDGTGGIDTNDIAVSTTVGATSQATEAIWGESERSSSDFLVVSGNGANSICFRQFLNATSAWEGAGSTCVDPDATAGNDVRFVMIKKNPVSTSDKMIVCQLSDIEDFTCAGWDGTTASMDATAEWTELDADITNRGAAADPSSRPFDIAWNPTGSIGIIAYDDTAGQIDWNRYGFTGATVSFNTTKQTAVTYADSHPWIRATTNPVDADNVNSLWMVMDSVSAFNIGSMKYTGGTSFTVISETSHTSDAGTFDTMELLDIKFQLLQGTSFETESLHDVTVSHSVEKSPSTFVREILNSITIDHSVERVLTAIREVLHEVSINHIVEVTKIIVVETLHEISVSHSVERTLTALRESLHTVIIDHTVERVFTGVRDILHTISVSHIVETVLTLGEPEPEPPSVGEPSGGGIPSPEGPLVIPSYVFPLPQILGAAGGFGLFFIVFAWRRERFTRTQAIGVGALLGAGLTMAAVRLGLFSVQLPSLAFLSLPRFIPPQINVLATRLGDTPSITLLALAGGLILFGGLVIYLSAEHS